MNPEFEERSFDHLARASISLLTEVISDPEAMENVEKAKAAKLAATSLSAWTRQNATENSRSALNFAMAREIAGDKDQLQRYIAITNPESPLVRALPEPK